MGAFYLRFFGMMKRKKTQKWQPTTISADLSWIQSHSPSVYTGCLHWTNGPLLTEVPCTAIWGTANHRQLQDDTCSICVLLLCGRFDSSHLPCHYAYLSVSASFLKLEKTRLHMNLKNVVEPYAKKNYSPLDEQVCHLCSEVQS